MSKPKRRTNITDEQTSEEYIVHIITSYSRGLDIQYRHLDRVYLDEEWIDMVTPVWNFDDIEFRVNSHSAITTKA